MIATAERRAARRSAGTSWAILTLLGTAELMLVLDVSIVNVALPAIHRELGLGTSSLQWVVNGYALTFGGLLLLGGRAADRLGGRRVLLWALTSFVLASLLCGLAPTPTVLVAARLVQGASAGILSPATLSLVTRMHRDPEERRRALAAWTAVAVGGGALGSLLGGVLTDALSWRWVFIVNVPVGAAVLVLGAARLPRDDRRAGRRPLDVAGAATATGGLMALVWALSHTTAAGWGSSEVVGALAVALALLAAFAVVEARLARQPLVPFSVFRSRSLAAGNALSFLSFVPVVATWFLLTLYLQGTRGLGALETGLAFLPMSLAVIGGSQLGFRAASRRGLRLSFAAGALLAAAGAAGLGQVTDHTSLAVVIGAGCLTMVGGGLAFAPVMLAATSGVGADREGLASGLVSTTRQLGGALGLAVLGTIAAGHGLRTALTAGAAVFLTAAVVGAVALPGRPPASR